MCKKKKVTSYQYLPNGFYGVLVLTCMQQSLRSTPVMQNLTNRLEKLQLFEFRFSTIYYGPLALSYYRSRES